jgi:hypothetical protein
MSSENDSKLQMRMERRRVRRAEFMLRLSIFRQKAVQALRELKLRLVIFRQKAAQARREIELRRKLYLKPPFRWSDMITIRVLRLIYSEYQSSRHSRPPHRV